LDLSGHGNNGVVVGNPIWVDGKFGKAVKFGFEDITYGSGYSEVPKDGYGGVEIPEGSRLITGDYTIEARIRLEGDPSDPNYFLMASRNFRVYFNCAKGQRLGADIPGAGFVQKDTISFYEWHSITLTYDSSISGGTGKFYLDAIEVASKINMGTTFETVLGTLALGKKNPPITEREIQQYHSLYFIGRIDEFRIYNRALNQEEIKQIYEENAPIDEEGLVLWLTFDEEST